MTDSTTALGIDVGGTNLRIAEIDAAGRILSRHAERVTNGQEAFSNRLAELVASHRSPKVKAVGIGIPGRVDAAAGLVLSAGYLDIGGLPLASWLGANTGLPVVVENDCSMALIAECAAGAAHGAENVVMFTIGTGIGGAIVQGGRPLHGHATAGQLGHITVRPGGERCNCGRRGCVETTSSGTSLGRLIREAGLAPETTVEALFARSEAGDNSASAVLRAWAEPMRDAATSMAAAFDPDLIVFGGGLGGAMVRALGQLSPETSWYSYNVRAAALGDDAGIIGGGLWALAAQRREGVPQSTLPAFAAEGGRRPAFNLQQR